MASSTSGAPEAAAAAVLVQSEPVPTSAVSVEGPNFDDQLDLQQLLASYERIGFQANSFGKAINIVNNMVRPCHMF
jgi:deoxyhypusine synthase